MSITRDEAIIFVRALHSAGMESDSALNTVVELIEQLGVSQQIIFYMVGEGIELPSQWL